MRRDDEPEDALVLGALTDEVDRLRRLFDSSWDMQAVHDEGGTFLDVSAASRRLFGWSRRDLVGTSMYDLVHPGDVDQVRDAHRRVLAGEVPVPTCFRLRCADGAHRWVQLVAVHEVEAIDHDPTIGTGSLRRGMQWTTRDVHERVEMEQRLHASVERFRAAMRSMAVGMVVLDPSTVLHLAAISDVVDRAAVFARELLLFSGQGERMVTEVDVHALVARSGALLDHTTGSAVVLTTELDAAPCIVLADERELESVVFALVLNAMAVAEGGGHVRVEVAARSRSGGPVELPSGVADWVLLRVSDDGAGMNEVVRARAFEPFFMTRPDGSGMGLAVVDRSVRDAGGVVELLSEEGRNTVVDVWLPAAGARAELAGRVELDLLVVDDQPEILELEARVLERAGHRVRRCASGDDALGVIDDGPLDTLVTDLVMPGTSGQELIAALLERRPTVGVVGVVGITPLPGDSERSHPDDAQEVAEPFRSSELVEAVRRAAAD